MKVIFDNRHREIIANETLGEQISGCGERILEDFSGSMPIKEIEIGEVEVHAGRARD
jgi:hypothetical protein